jgi:hypothetical protein
MGRYLFVAFLGFCLSGCVSSKMNSIMASWEGAHIDRVIAQWGYPAGERRIAGRTLYVWDRNVSVAMPSTTTVTGTVSPGGSYSATGVTTGGGTFHGSCRRILEVNDRGYVVGWQWEGNNCPFAETGPYAAWRRSQQTTIESPPQRRVTPPPSPSSSRSTDR